MTIKEIRALTGLSRIEFSSRYNIPQRTLVNWEQDTESKYHRECPEYVRELLEFKVRYDLERGEFADKSVIKEDFKFCPYCGSQMK